MLFRGQTTQSRYRPSWFDTPAQTVFNNEWFGAPTPPPATGRLKVWTGSAWVAKPVKVWTGSAWVEKPIKFWNGSAWA